MILDSDENLDALIREEKQRVASHFLHEAWDSALEEGIEPTILADSAIDVALTRLFTEAGEDNVRGLIESLSDRLASGHFDASRVLQ
ncbi:hypothetical protein [Ahrensia sp. R2A130]|uniref:hypothetical protein n=1 Tax=Ahrensia sp. R2A130 TaxID=744979 RepID=UPI0001E0A43A|nr:hypothetical protein [Ahrensia sp. R2A130]EFL90642.1 putative cytoplasmic protein [Ahrensia sp. R2A130]